MDNITRALDTLSLDNLQSSIKLLLLEAGDDVKERAKLIHKYLYLEE